MKRIALRAISAAMVLCLLLGLSVPSLANDVIAPISAPISTVLSTSVYANDELVAFTDAVPMNYNAHVMLPLRDVMESLGALVDYDGANKLITVAYGGAKVGFGLNGSDADLVIAGGEASKYAINPVPVNSNGRILVPSSFFSDCFGLTVGINTGSVTVTDFTGVFDSFDGTYEILTKSMEAAALEGALAQDGKYSGKVSVKSEPDEIDLSIPFSGDMSALSEGLIANGSMGMKLDLSSLAGLAGDDQDIAMLMLMLAAAEDIQADYIVDAGTGDMYLKSALISLLSGYTGAEEVWYKLDLGVTNSAGASAVSFEDTIAEVVIRMAAQMPGQSLSSAKIYMAVVEEMISDKAFIKSGTDEKPVYTMKLNMDTYTDIVIKAAEAAGLTGFDEAKVRAELEEMGINLDLAMVFSFGDVYSQSLDMTVSVKEEGVGEYSMTMKMSSAYPGKTTLSMTMSMDIETVKVDMEFALESELKETDEKPVSAPPEGAVIEDLKIA